MSQTYDTVEDAQAACKREHDAFFKALFALSDAIEQAEKQAGGEPSYWEKQKLKHLRAARTNLERAAGISGITQYGAGYGQRKIKVG